MAEGSKLDMFMMLIEKGKSDGIKAEGQSQLEEGGGKYGGGLMQGFKEGQFFEATKIDFGIDAIDQEVDTRHKSNDPKDQQQKFGRFSKWIQNQATEFRGKDGQNRLYPVEMKPVKVTRRLDVASPLLFTKCFYTREFDSAALVLRYSKGAHAFTGTTVGYAHMPFLRIDFKTVLVVSVDWDLSDYVEEEFEFICREVQVQYQGQTAAGTPHDKLKSNTGGYLSLEKTNSE